jgi:hypothetical protein
MLVLKSFGEGVPGEWQPSSVLRSGCNRGFSETQIQMKTGYGQGWAGEA